jgi:hypothetical protein
MRWCKVARNSDPTANEASHLDPGVDSSAMNIVLSVSALVGGYSLDGARLNSRVFGDGAAPGKLDAKRAGMCIAGR